jgi:hypothetical protein
MSTTLLSLACLVTSGARVAATQWLPAQIGGPPGLAIFLLLWHGEANRQLAATGEHRLAAAIADADRLDPGWRWADLEKKRAAVPDEKNSALFVIAARKLMPKYWPSSPKPPPGEDSLSYVDSRVREVPPERRLPEELFQELADELKSAEAAVIKARGIADLPHGRYPLNHWRLAGNPHQTDVHLLVDLLHMDAVALAHLGKMNEAVFSLRAAINVSRSLGDETFWISCSQRRIIAESTGYYVRRILAQGTPGDGALLSLQTLYAEEAERPAFLLLARAARAELEEDMEELGTLENKREALFKELKAEQFARLLFGPLISGRYLPQERGDALAQKVKGMINDLLKDTSGVQLPSWDFAELGLSPSVLLTVFPAVSLHVQAARMEAWNAAVELAKLPDAEQLAALRRIAEQSPAVRSNWFNRGRELAFRLERHNLTSRAYFRSITTALAIERYRIAHGRWPESLQQLVPQFIGNLPLDPFDGQALRYRRLPDGVVVYSIGWDGIDDGGDVNGYETFGMSQAKDIGFRLWDPNKRRQPAGSRRAKQ